MHSDKRKCYNVTLKTVTFVVQGTRKHSGIVSHQKWATVCLFIRTVDKNITIITAKV